MNISKKSRSVFGIRGFIILLLSLCLLIPGFFIEGENEKIAYFIGIGGLNFIVLILAIIWPNLKYKHMSYTYDEEKMVIKQGVIFRSEIIIPMIQVQDVNTFQGPLMIMFNLKGIYISTAGSNRSITCLDSEVAEKLIQEINNNIYYRKRKNEEI